MSISTHHKKKGIAAVLLLCTSLAILLFLFFKEPSYRGQMEAEVFANPTEVSAKILEMPISLGQEVEKGDTIAVLDSTDQEYAVKQLEISLKKAMLALGDAKGGAGSSAGSALLSSQAAYNTAAATEKQAAEDYRTALSLYEEGALTRQALDQASLAASTAADTAASSRAQLSSAGSHFAEENSQLDVALLQSRLAQARSSLEKYTIKACEPGTVISLSFTEGDFVASGADLTDIASKEERYLLFYLPVEKTDLVTFGEPVSLTFQGKAYAGEVVYLDLKSTYTPREFQSSADKDRKNVRIKLKLPQDCPMVPGQFADIRLK